MRYSYELIKDKLNVISFETLNELLKVIETHLKDGDTILIKSSHSTGLSKVLALLSGEIKLPPATLPALNVPEPLFDVKNFLPQGITPQQNGRMPADKLKTSAAANGLKNRRKIGFATEYFMRVRSEPVISRQWIKVAEWE